MATKTVWNQFKSGDRFYLYSNNAMVAYEFMLASSEGQALCERLSDGEEKLIGLQSKNVYTREKARFNKTVKTQLLDKNVWFKYVTVVTSENNKEEVHVEYGKVEYISINTMKCCVKGYEGKYHEIPFSYIIQTKTFTLKDRNK